MARSLIWFLLILGLILVGAEVAWTQENAWPEFPLDPNSQHNLPRGPGNYLSWVKLGLLIAIYLGWVKTTDWANRDCQIRGLPYSTWNMVLVAPFVVGLLLALSIPLFAAGYAVLALTYIGPLVAYIVKRNSVVLPHERVLTPAHIRFLLSQRAQGMVAEEGKQAHEKGAPVVFHALGGSPNQNQSNIIWARQSPGYLPAKDLVVELLRQRADRCMLDFTSDAVAVRYQIDGVWHESEPQDRESGDALLAVFKKMANLNIEDRRKRQAGTFSAEHEKRKYGGHIVSQGTQTGERVIIQLVRPHSDFKTLRDLGMRDKVEDRLKQLLASPKGIVLFSSPPSGGLTTTMRLGLGLTDRFLRDFVAFQPANAPEPLVDNIELTTFDPSKGEVPQKILESLLRREPNAVVVSELPNVETATMLCEHAARDKLVITGVRAKEAVEALLRVLVLKVPAAKFAPVVLGVVNQRLIRKLCEECKQAYDPAPQLLQKLGIPAGRIEKLYRPPEANEQEKVCPVCNGLGYFGQTAIFELLVVDKAMRDAIEKQPKLEVLRQVAKQGGNRNLQQEGIVLVAQGLTSVQELSRVLKQ